MLASYGKRALESNEIIFTPFLIFLNNGHSVFNKESRWWSCPVCLLCTWEIMQPPMFSFEYGAWTCCFFSFSIGGLKKHEDNTKIEKDVSRKHTREEQSLKISFFVSIQNQSKFLLGFSLMDQKNKYRLSEISWLHCTIHRVTYISGRKIPF